MYQLEFSIYCVITSSTLQNNQIQIILMNKILKYVPEKLSFRHLAIVTQLKIHKITIHHTVVIFPGELKSISRKNDTCNLVDHDFCYKNTFKRLFFHFFQNFLNESLKFLDKMYPNNSHLSGLHTVASVSSSLDTKPLHLDAKSLLNHGVSTTTTTNNNNSTTVALETKK